MRLESPEPAAPSAWNATHVAISPWQSIAATLGRHKASLLLIPLLAALAAFALAALIPLQYSATTRLLVDPRDLKVLEKDPAPHSNETDQSSAVIESEAHVLSSALVLEQVVRQHGLDKDPLFAATGTGESPLAQLRQKLNELRDALGVGPPPTPPAKLDPEAAAIRALETMVRVQREPQSYILNITVKSRDPLKSRDIANWIAQAYIESRSKLRTGILKRTGGELESHLEEQRKTLEEADRKVQQFKAAKGLAGPATKLVHEEQLADATAQLSTAHAETVRASSRFEQIKEAARQGGTTSIESLRIPSIELLSGRLTATRQKAAMLGASMLPGHPVMRQLHQEEAEIRSQLDREIARLVDGAKLEYQKAKTNEDQLSQSLEKRKNAAFSANADIVALRELERKADATRTVYESFLVRSRELNEQQGVDSSVVTVLTPAVAPDAPSGIRRSFLALIAGLGTFGLALGYGLLRDERSPLMLGMDHMNRIATDDATEIPGVSGRARSLAGRLWNALRLPYARWDDRPLVPRYVVDDPGSSTTAGFVEAYQKARVKLGAKSPSLILVTAAETHQGKSTVALNLALAARDAGENVLLIDADREHQSLTLDADAPDRNGLMDVLLGRIALEKAILAETHESPSFLPLGHVRQARSNVPPKALLSPAALVRASAYDLIVVDAGLALSDRWLASWARMAGSIVLVVRAGLGHKTATLSALEALQRLAPDGVLPVMLTDD